MYKSQNAPISWDVLKEISLEFPFKKIKKPHNLASQVLLLAIAGCRNLIQNSLSFKKLSAGATDFEGSLRERKEIYVKRNKYTHQMLLKPYIISDV